MDIIRDFLDRVAEALGPETFTDQLAVTLEQQMRSDWGGDRPYVPKSSDADLSEITRRDISIRRDHRAGEGVTFLSRRYGLSRKRIYQIITA